MTRVILARAIAFCLALLLLSGGVLAAELTDAQAAIERRDYSAALGLLEPLVAKGRPDAIYLMGTLYANGDGVDQDDARALRLFRQAAAKGHKLAKQQIVALFKSGSLVEPSPDDWRVQLGTAPSAPVAEKEWKRMVKSYPDYLAGLEIDVVPVERAGKQVFAIQGIKLDESVARSICADLIDTVYGCRIIKPAPKTPPAGDGNPATATPPG
jgi:hypothetical protein